MRQCAMFSCVFAMVAALASAPVGAADVSGEPAPTNADDATRIAVLLDRIKALEDTDPKAALAAAEQANALLATRPTDPRYRDLLLTLGRQYVNQSRYEAALQAVQSARALTGFADNAEAVISALKIEALIAREQSRLDTALNLLQQAQATALRSGEEALIAAVQYELAIIYFFQGKLSDTIREVSKASDFYQRVGNHKRHGKALNILGIAYGSQGRYDESLATMMQALALARSNRDDKAEMSLINNVAVTLQRLNRSEEALANYQEALTLARTLGDRHSEALALLNIGSTLNSLQQLDAAVQYHQQGNTIAEALGAQALRVRALSGMANIARAKRDLAAVKRYAQAGLRLIEESGNQEAAFGIRLDLAWYYLETKAYPDAWREAHTVLTRAQQEDDRDSMSSAMALLSDISSRMGKPADALAFYKQHVELQNQMFNDKSDQTIAGLRARFEAEQKDREIDRLEMAQQHAAQQLQQQQQQQQLLLERKQWQRNVLVFTIAGSFLLAFLIYRRVMEHRLNVELSRQVAARTEALKRKNEELHKAYQLVEERSMTDELTGLSNRRYLLHHLPDDIAGLQERYRERSNHLPSSDEALLFFLVDLDHFKSVNDQYGHAAGDLVLTQVSALLSQVFRQTDHLVRWGGEEFLIVVRFAKRSEAPQYAERLRKTIEGHAFSVGDGRDLQRTCSIGFSCYPCFRAEPEQVSWAQVIDIADLCLYAAKKSHRNAWVGLEFFDSNGDEALFPALLTDVGATLKRLQPTVQSSLAKPQSLVWH